MTVVSGSGAGDALHRPAASSTHAAHAVRDGGATPAYTPERARADAGALCQACMGALEFDTVAALLADKTADDIALLRTQFDGVHRQGLDDTLLTVADARHWQCLLALLEGGRAYDDGCVRNVLADVVGWREDLENGCGHPGELVERLAAAPADYVRAWTALYADLHGDAPIDGLPRGEAAAPDYVLREWATCGLEGAALARAAELLDAAHAECGQPARAGETVTALHEAIRPGGSKWPNRAGLREVLCGCAPEMLPTLRALYLARHPEGWDHLDAEWQARLHPPESAAGRDYAADLAEWHAACEVHRLQAALASAGAVRTVREVFRHADPRFSCAIQRVYQAVAGSSLHERVAGFGPVIGPALQRLLDVGPQAQWMDRIDAMAREARALRAEASQPGVTLARYRALGAAHQALAAHQAAGIEALQRVRAQWEAAQADWPDPMLAAPDSEDHPHVVIGAHADGRPLEVEAIAPFARPRIFGDPWAERRTAVASAMHAALGRMAEAPDGAVLGRFATEPVFDPGAARPAHELVRIRQPQCIAPSPDGWRALVTVAGVKHDDHRYPVDLYLLSSDPLTPARRLDLHGRVVRDIKWHPSGRAFAFLDRRCHLCLQILPEAAAGTPPVHEMAKLKHRGVVDFAWDPAGKRIAFVTADPMRGSGATNGKPANRIWVLDIDVDAPAGGGQPQLLLDAGEWTVGHGLKLNTPCSLIDWLPDGSGLVFSYAPGGAGQGRAALAELALSSGRVTPLTPPARTIFSPRCDPWGDHVAAMELDMETHNPEVKSIADVVVVARADRAVRSLAPTLDRSLRSTRLLGWSMDPAGRPTVLMTEMQGAGRALCALPADGSRPAATLLHVPPHPQSGFAASGAGPLWLTLPNASDGLPEVHVLPEPAAATTAPAFRKVSAFNAALPVRPALRQEAVAGVQDGRPVNGLVIYPTGFEPGRRYPLVLGMHGAPNISMGLFPSASYPRMPADAMAAAQCLAFFANPFGSTGAGPDARHHSLFSDDNARSKAELAAGIRYVARHYPVDLEQLVLFGHSWGTFLLMDMLLAGELREFQIKALVLNSPVAEVPRLNAQTDPENIFGSYGEEERLAMSLLERLRRGAFDPEAIPPTLLLQGTDDRVTPAPTTRGMAEALAAHGIPVTMVLYPDEAHAHTRPSTHLSQMEVVQQMLQAHVAPR